MSSLAPYDFVGGVCSSYLCNVCVLWLYLLLIITWHFYLLVLSVQSFDQNCMRFTHGIQQLIIGATGTEACLLLF
jgi:hypothetical protein